MRVRVRESMSGSAVVLDCSKDEPRPGLWRRASQRKEAERRQEAQTETVAPVCCTTVPDGASVFAEPRPEPAAVTERSTNNIERNRVDGFSLYAVVA